jgi:hypothetical protein
LSKEFLKIGTYEVLNDHSIIVSGGTYKMSKNNDACERASSFVTPRECCYVASGDKRSAKKNREGCENKGQELEYYTVQHIT